MPLEVSRIPALAESLATKSPQDILAVALKEYSPSIGIAFSGAEDVVLIDMAAKSGLPFTVFSDRRGRVVAAHLGELTEPEAALILDAVRHVNAGKRSPEQARKELESALAALPPPPEDSD